MDEKIDKCVELAQDNAEKMDKVLADYAQVKHENDVLTRVIKWLVAAIIAGIVTAGIVAGIFVYGYMFSPYLYGGEISQGVSGDSGNQVQVIGG